MVPKKYKIKKKKKPLIHGLGFPKHFLCLRGGNNKYGCSFK